MFHVAHHEVKIARRETVADQGTEVFPLQHRSILKLINHKMIDVDAGFFVNERGIAVVDNPVEQQVRIGNEHDVLFGGEFFYLHGQVRQDTQCIEMFPDDKDGIIKKEILFKQLFQCKHFPLQSVIKGLFYSINLIGRGGFSSIAKLYIVHHFHERILQLHLSGSNFLQIFHAGT
ncbi:hypothetical protein SDC9_200920 [bioreactor metagenome]|uniref:Uncharacterized protein n=1 Tax=bioreactor metagenome TaxID=1076179 RepID=A0A645IQ87_9ZZZZ